MEKKICITGIGIISSLGYSPEEYWKNLIANRDSRSEITTFSTDQFRSHFGFPITDFVAADHIMRPYLRPLDVVTKYSIAAVGKAITSAGLHIDDNNCQRAAIIAGSMFHGIGAIFNFKKACFEDGKLGLSPLFFPGIVFNSLSGQPAIEYNFQGPNVAVNHGTASGLFAVIKGMDYLKAGHVDVVVAGGAEMLHEFSFACCQATNSLAVSGPGGEVCLPFDRARNGYMLGEGACFFVLEKMEAAIKKGRPVYAVLDRCDSGFVSAQAEGDWQQNYISALNEVISGIAAAKKIDLIISDGSGDKVMDFIEAKALSRFPGDKLPVVTSPKANIGHTLGASGAFNLLTGIMAITKSEIPRVKNLEQPEIELNYARACLKQDIDHVLVNSLDANGNFASICIKKSEK